MKKIIAYLISMALAISCSMVTFAADTPQQEFICDLEEINLNLPYNETKEYTTPNGENLTLNISFTPAPQTRFSETKDATVGVWDVWMSYGVFWMEYSFDLSHPDGWKISNPRNLDISGILMEVKEKELSIGRAESTPSFPATVSAVAFCSLFDNSWVHIGDATYILDVEVAHDGELIISW